MSEAKKRRESADTKVTTMRLNVKVLKAADKRAAKLNMFRSMYFETLLRKDLGMEGSEYDIFA